MTAFLSWSFGWHQLGEFLGAGLTHTDSWSSEPALPLKLQVQHLSGKLTGTTCPSRPLKHRPIPAAAAVVASLQEELE